MVSCLTRCPLDFSRLEVQEKTVQASGFWYVLLLLDTNKAGHTCVIKTTHPEAYGSVVGKPTLDTPPAIPKSSTHNAAATPVLPTGAGGDGPNLVSAGGGGGQAWRLAVAIPVGVSENEASEMIDIISTSAKGKQVRGGMQRAARADLIATRKHKSVFADFCVLLNISVEQLRLNVLQVGYAF